MKALTKCKYPKWALDKVEKRLNRSTSEVIDELTTEALQLPRLPPMELKPRVTLSYPTHKVFVKASKRSVVDMAFKPKTSWSPPRTKTLWPTKVVPYTGTNVMT